MTLIPVFFEIEGSPSKALVEEDMLEFYLNLGAKQVVYIPKKKKRKLKTIPPRKIVAQQHPPKRMPQKQPSAPTRRRSINITEIMNVHRSRLAAMDTFSQIQAYIMGIINKSLEESTNNIEQDRRIAMRHIRRSIDADICE